MHDIRNKPGKYNVDNPGFDRLLDMLPDKALDLSGTQLGQPTAMAYLGTKADISKIRAQAKALQGFPPENICETAMLMAEIIESSAPERDKYFQTDAKTRDEVFNGSKWRSGWVFLMGSNDHSELAQKFRELEFLVFVQNGGTLQKVINLGPRETAAVYFLQVMVRYAMIWGGVAPGDDHEMSHYLEKDMPGVVVAHGKLTPVEELLLLALMKMGAPAVVPQDYPYDFGRYVRAKGTEQIIEAATKFPNLRVKEIQGKKIELPAFCNPANMRAEFIIDKTIGGGDSFFVLKPGDVEERLTLPKKRDLSGTTTIGIQIQIGDKRLDVSTSEYLERSAIRGISLIKGLRAERDKENSLFIHTEKGIIPDTHMIAETLHKWIAFEFPYIEKIHISIITGEKARKASMSAKKFQSKRFKMIAEESDDNVRYFNYCLECQPFAKDHVCIITPDRPPMCGRDRFQVKAAALFGASWHPWKRRDLESQDIRGSIEAGAPIDAKNGEYASANKAVEQFSPSHIKRVQLHGLREFPHTSCGCFQYLVFWIESLKGIGIMERDYQYEAPEGLTWDLLANAAGGKQAPGITGVSRFYLRSKRFMQGEGGLAAVRWFSPKAQAALKDLLPDPGKVQVGK